MKSPAPIGDYQKSSPIGNWEIKMCFDLHQNKVVERIKSIKQPKEKNEPEKMTILFTLQKPEKS